MARKKTTTKRKKKATTARRKTATKRGGKKKSKKKTSTKKRSAKSASKKQSTKTSTKKKTMKKKGGRKKKASTKRGKKKTTKKKSTRSQQRKAVSAVKQWTAPSRAGGFSTRPIKMMDPDEVTKTKTNLATKELKEYRKLLLLKRAEILGDMESMSTEALNADAANLSHMPLHMADVGSDLYEQELTLGLVESERKLLQEIIEALERIAKRTYGICQATGKPIAKSRLKAKPWAKYCIEAAREMERNGQRW